MNGDPARSPKLDLRSGASIWERDDSQVAQYLSQVPKHLTCEIIIVGAGITGAFIAEHLSRTRPSIVVLDRHRPQTASTAASTALLQWEIDAPLLDLEQRIGFEHASAVYQRSRRAVDAIGALCSSLDFRCDFSWRNSLYFAGSTLDLPLLREEHRIRAHAGIEGEVLDAEELAARFGFERAGALLYAGSAEAHPIDLARCLMHAAVARGVQVYSPADVVAYACSAVDGVEVATGAGSVIRGKTLILANGYEMPGFVRSGIHKLASTWALATVPQPDGVIWPERCLAWEASEPYCYMRTTHDNEIIIGGEDEDDLTDAGDRDRRTPAKVAVLLERLKAFVPGARTEVRASWAGFFGTTEDALPLIGAVPGQPNCFAAFGYGGNGITYSAIAASLLAKLVAGERDPLLEIFAVDRRA